MLTICNHTLNMGDKMIIIGIDTGAKGAIAEIDVDNRYVRWMKLPYRDDGILNSLHIRENFSLSSADKIAIEEVSFIRGAKGSATFGLGKNYGMILSLIECYPYELIRPQKWHKLINGKKDKEDERTTKERSKASFVRLNPTFGKIIKEHHEGLIDAFFIGYSCGLLSGLVMPNGFNFERLC